MNPINQKCESTCKHIGIKYVTIKKNCQCQECDAVMKAKRQF